MYTKSATIINRTGLHARPASVFVMEAKKFVSKITIRNLTEGGSAVNAKSIARLLAEGIGQGAQVEISAEGDDEQQAIDSLESLIAAGFGE
ncbi:MAG: HPr family phosphocarrier protein [Lachnospiraceae bacterium]|nr:HPr family phosphocarrier protein [Lachnospiraceae bacterium]